MGRYWTPEQVEKKRAYFQKERTEQEGIFTELVVRMYYLTYRAIAANGGDCCSTKEVKPYRVKDEIYEGLGDPHDYLRAQRHQRQHGASAAHALYPHEKGRQGRVDDLPEPAPGFPPARGA